MPGYTPGDGADAPEAARLRAVTQGLTQRPWTECAADSSVLQFWLPELGKNKVLVIAAPEDPYLSLSAARNARPELRAARSSPCWALSLSGSPRWRVRPIGDEAGGEGHGDQLVLFPKGSGRHLGEKNAKDKNQIILKMFKNKVLKVTHDPYVQDFVLLSFIFF